jgi:hypothetical protein
MVLSAVLKISPKAVFNPTHTVGTVTNRTHCPVAGVYVVPAPTNVRPVVEGVVAIVIVMIES